MSGLTKENYRRGFLVDDELLAAVGDEEGGGYFAYVLRSATAEYLGYRVYPSLEEALDAINAIPRGWAFEGVGGCDGTRCAEGKCKGEKCSLFRPCAS